MQNAALEAHLTYMRVSLAQLVCPTTLARVLCAPVSSDAAPSAAPSAHGAAKHRHEERNAQNSCAAATFIPAFRNSSQVELATMPGIIISFVDEQVAKVSPIVCGWGQV